MRESRPPPTELGSQSSFALHIANGVLTVWFYHRDLGLHEATWEEREKYEIDERVDVSGSGRLIKTGEDVWYLVDTLEDIHPHGEYQKVKGTE